MVTLPGLDGLPEARTVELPGRGTTRVLDTGPREAPPLILLHALACTGALTWYPSLPALRAQHRVIAFDQRWHGQGIRSPRFRLIDCADDVSALADELGIDRFLVGGYSLGSLVAQLSWHRHPGRVAGMVLCAGTRSFRGTRRERVMLDGYRAAVRRLPGRLHGTPRGTAAAAADSGDVYGWAFGQFRSTAPSAIAGALAEISRFDSSSWIGGVDVPTAVVVNTRDRLIPTSRQRSLARHIPNATVHEVRAGHAACVLHAGPFVPAMVDACASVRRRTNL